MGVSSAEVGARTGLVLVGDSLTAGWLDAGWAALQHPALQNRRPLNLGLGGDQTQHIIWRLQDADDGGDDPAAAASASAATAKRTETGTDSTVGGGSQLRGVNKRCRLVVLLAGTNNSRWGVRARDTLYGLRRIVLQLLAHFDPGVQVLVLHVLPRSDWLAPFLLNQEINSQLRAALHDPLQGVHVYDLSSTFLSRSSDGPALTAQQDALPPTNSTLYSHDRLHLSPAGYDAWADALAPILDRHAAIADEEAAERATHAN